MISRRNIRIKVFQTIYELNQQHDALTPQEAILHFNRKLDETAALFAATNHLLCTICDYVLVYANQRASKFMPSAEDLQVNTKIAGNTILQNLKRNVSLPEVLKKHKLANLFDDELVRKIFISLSETVEYKAYIAEPERSAVEEKKILELIIRDFIFHHDAASSFLDEQFISWTLDFEMIESWMEKVLMNASRFNFTSILSDEKLTFAHDLLKTYIDKKDLVFTLIEPKLVNWDADRVAVVDLILLHLGICELLYFPTIPVKVTINEYIDLAKSFSTLQSGQFVNGLLDNVRKELMAENKIIKDDLGKNS